MRNTFFIVTNNPLVLEKLEDEGRAYSVIYMPAAYEEILKEVRGWIHRGHVLLTHPLSGSVKPNETPYKSVLMSSRIGDAEEQALSVKLIESALAACGKFQRKSDGCGPEILADFQLIDWTLLESAIGSAAQ